MEIELHFIKAEDYIRHLEEEQVAM